MLNQKIYRQIEFVNRILKNGSTMLHCTCASGHLNFTKLLIKRGAFVNSLNSDKMTPLDKAYEYGNVETAEHLVSLGAKILATEHNFCNDGICLCYQYNR